MSQSVWDAAVTAANGGAQSLAYDHIATNAPAISVDDGSKLLYFD